MGMTLAQKILARASGRTYRVQPMPSVRQAIIDAGGLIPYTRQRLLHQADRP